MRSISGAGRPLAAGLAFAIALACGLGCASNPADPDAQIDSLEDAQRRYTQLVRWGEIERAGTYVDQAALEDFLGLAEAFEKIRITDFETGIPVYGDGGESASVEVTYHAYSLLTMLETRVRARQEWHRDGEDSSVWRVKPEIAGIVEALHGGVR